MNFTFLFNRKDRKVNRRERKDILKTLRSLRKTLRPLRFIFQMRKIQLRNSYLVTRLWLVKHQGVFETLRILILSFP